MPTTCRTECLRHSIGAAPKSRIHLRTLVYPRSHQSAIEYCQLQHRSLAFKIGMQSAHSPLSRATISLPVPRAGVFSAFSPMNWKPFFVRILSNDNCILFCSFMLGKDSGVVQNQDIKQLLGRRLIAWEAGRFDLLLAEYTLCAHSMHTLHSRRRLSSQDYSSHIRAFTRFLLQGDFRRAIRLLMNQDKSRCLLPDDIADPRSVSQDPQTVHDVLKDKQPDGRTGPNLNVTRIDESLPFLEAIDVTEYHPKTVAHALKPSSGGSTGIHWGYGKGHYSILAITAVISARPWPASESLVFFPTLTSHGIVSRP